MDLFKKKNAGWQTARKVTLPKRPHRPPDNSCSLPWKPCWPLLFLAFGVTFQDVCWIPQNRLFPSLPQTCYLLWGKVDQADCVGSYLPLWLGKVLILQGGIGENSHYSNQKKMEKNKICPTLFIMHWEERFVGREGMLFLPKHLEM